MSFKFALSIPPIHSHSPERDSRRANLLALSPLENRIDSSVNLEKDCNQKLQSTIFFHRLSYVCRSWPQTVLPTTHEHVAMWHGPKPVNGHDAGVEIRDGYLQGKPPGISPSLAWKCMDFVFGTERGGLCTPDCHSYAASRRLLNSTNADSVGSVRGLRAIHIDCTGVNIYIYTNTNFYGDKRHLSASSVSA